MPLKSRLRRALGRASPDSTPTSSTAASSSNSATDLSHIENVLTTTPSNMPTITLTKTSSRLSKITSWRAERKKEKWVEPKSKYPGVKNFKHQEMLRQFEMKFGREGRPSLDGRWSVFSGISPMASRNCSLDMGPAARRGSALGGLSRQVSHDDGREKQEVETVEEE